MSSSAQYILDLRQQRRACQRVQIVLVKPRADNSICIAQVAGGRAAACMTAVPSRRCSVCAAMYTNGVTASAAVDFRGPHRVETHAFDVLDLL